MDRRAFLQNAGIAVAIPLLDVMLPYSRKALAADVKPQYFLLSRFPNGYPTGTNFYDEGYQLLKDIWSDLVVTKGWRNNIVDTAGAVFGNGHTKGQCVIMSCAAPKKLTATTWNINKTMDQYIADLTPTNLMRSLSIVGHKAGGADANVAWEHTQSMFSNGDGNLRPAFENPWDVYQQFFKASTAAGQVQANGQFYTRGKNVVDLAYEQYKGLYAKVSEDDRRRLTEYGDGMSDLRKSLSGLDTSPTDPSVLQCGVAPVAGSIAKYPPTQAEYAAYPITQYDQRMKILQDLIVKAMQCDRTRVITTVIGSEATPSNAFPGVTGSLSWHQTSHYFEGEGTAYRKPRHTAAVNYCHTWYRDLFLKLKKTNNPYGPLSQQCASVLFSDLMDSNSHFNYNMQVYIAGQLNGQIRTGQTIDAGNKELAVLWLTLIQAMEKSALGKVKTTAFGDANGQTIKLT